MPSSLDDIGLDPYAARKTAISRKLALAQALQQQGLDPLPSNRQVGGWAIKTSPFEGLAKLAQTYVGAKAGQKAETEQAELGKQSASDYQAMLVKALSQMQSDPQGAMGTLGTHLGGAAIQPMAMDAFRQQALVRALQDEQSQGQPGMPPSAPGPSAPPGTPGPGQVPPQAQGGALPGVIGAPQVGVTAPRLPDYQALAAEARAKARRVMPLNAAMGNHLLESADRLEKMGMEKDVKPIVNENFPISGTQQQPHEYNRQTGQWEPIKNAAQRPIFNPQPLVRIGMQQETAESQGVGKGFSEAYNDIQKAGIAANGKINNLTRLSQLLEGVETGKLTPLGTDIAGYAASAGLKIDKNIGNKQAAEALSNEIALQLRNPSGGAGMPGAMSDADRQFLVSMTPGLSKTPQGRKQITETGLALAKRDQDVARLAREYRKKNGHMDEGFYDELQKFSDANPLFGKKEAQTTDPQSGATVRPYTGQGGGKALNVESGPMTATNPKTGERIISNDGGKTWQKQ